MNWMFPLFPCRHGPPVVPCVVLSAVSNRYNIIYIHTFISLYIYIILFLMAWYISHFIIYCIFKRDDAYIYIYICIYINITFICSVFFVYLFIYGLPPLPPTSDFRFVCLGFWIMSLCCFLGGLGLRFCVLCLWGLKVCPDSLG